jgi:sec-independent protein translocase protein TatA
MFDPSAPHIIILLVVVLLLFGSTRLPGAAKALGSSMRIFKREMKDMHADEDKPASAPAAFQQGTLPPAPLPPAPPAAQAPPQPVATPVGATQGATQQQVEDLQRQIAELRRQEAGTGQGSVPGEPAEAPRDQPL